LELRSWKRSEFMSNIAEFLKLAGKLKKIERTGWVTRVGIENPESVSDHSFRTALIAMIVGDMKKIDSNKLMRMLLIHDLGESLIGDFDIFAKKKIGENIWKEKEKRAVHEILFENLPKNVAEDYYNLWVEFDEHKTELAKLAHEIDKLEVLLQAVDYEKSGYDKNKLEIFWKISNPLVKDSHLRDILEAYKIRVS